MATGSGKESLPERANHLDRERRLALAAAMALVGAAGLALCSTRFGISQPGVIDDWLPATGPYQSAGDLLGHFFEAGQRYRPTYDIAEYSKWHVLGGPRSTTAAEIWNVFRMLLFLAAVTLVPAIAATSGRDRTSALWLGALAVVPALIIFAGPETDVDFLRLGIQEPFMFGAMVCGLALVIGATARMLEGGTPGWQVGSLYAAGYALWLAGVFHKEASVAAAVAAPFLYLHLDRSWRERGLIDGPLWRERTAQLAAVPLALIVAAMAIGVSSSSGQGVTLYGAAKPHGLGGWLDRAVDSARLQWDALGGAAQAPQWRIVAVAVPVLIVAAGFYRKRVPWLAIGMFLTGWAVLIIQGAVLFPVTRYLIPGIALFAMAAVVVLVELPMWVRAAALALALALAISKADTGHHAVSEWTALQEDNERAIDAIANLDPAHCPVYFGFMPYEMGDSVPRLVGLRTSSPDTECSSKFEGVVVGFEPRPYGPLAADDSVSRACASRPTLLLTIPGHYQQEPWVIAGCRRFRKKLGAESVADVLLQNRLVPGLGIFDARKECAARFGTARCTPHLQGPQKYFATH